MFVVLGNMVMIYANSMVLREVAIQDGTIIGAHSMAIENTEVNGIHVGVPAKKLK